MIVMMKVMINVDDNGDGYDDDDKDGDDSDDVDFILSCLCIPFPRRQTYQLTLFNLIFLLFYFFL
jgi:hypothetical protein